MGDSDGQVGVHAANINMNCRRHTFRFDPTIRRGWSEKHWNMGNQTNPMDDHHFPKEWPNWWGYETNLLAGTDITDGWPTSEACEPGSDGDFTIGEDGDFYMCQGQKFDCIYSIYIYILYIYIYIYMHIYICIHSYCWMDLDGWMVIIPFSQNFCLKPFSKDKLMCLTS